MNHVRRARNFKISIVEARLQSIIAITSLILEIFICIYNTEPINMIYLKV